MQFRYNDGGRAEAGFKGNARDCVTRAIAIVSGLPYKDVYGEISRRLGKGKSPRDGVKKNVYEPYMEELGFEWTPTMKIGQGCKVHLEPEELPSGRIIARCSRHVVAVIDGVVHDTYDSTREGKRCVYGYWTYKGERY